MDEIIIGIFKVQSDFALEVWFSIVIYMTYSSKNGAILKFMLLCLVE